MSVLQIVCQNCGAKYKLPESFPGDKAKCKACGAVIDVAAQRGGGGETGAAAPKPAAVKPAAVKPATGKSAAPRPARAASEGRSAAGKGTTNSAGASGRRGAGATSAASSSRTGRAAGGRRGAADAETKKKGNPALLIGAVVVIVAIVVGVLMSGGDKPDPAETQTAQGVDATKPADTAAPSQTPEPQAEEAAPAADQTPAAVTPPADEAAKETPAPKSEPAKPTPSPAKTEVTSRADVFDPKTLAPLEYPAEVDAALQTEIEGLLQDMADGGVSGIRAKGRLEEIGWAALFGIINRLRTIDYFDSSESMSAYELNRLLEAMAVGINVGYRPPQIGEDQSLEDIDWNAKTVKAWTRLPAKYPTPEDFDRLRQNRQTRNQGR
ncbi:MAG: hypothetical protein RL562_3150 [Planctomycetota bacterium]|jgi:hypothetical protein